VREAREGRKQREPRNEEEEAAMALAWHTAAALLSHGPLLFCVSAWDGPMELQRQNLLRHTLRTWLLL
jgi:hypothetical protein